MRAQDEPVAALCAVLTLCCAVLCRAVLRCGVLCCRLDHQALADLCVARQLYSSTLMRIKQQRQLLVLQMAQIVSSTHSRSTEQTYRTDAVFYGVSGERMHITPVQLVMLYWLLLPGRCCA